MRKGINIWAFRDQSDLRRCMILAHKAGFEGIELAYALKGPIGPESTPEDMKAILQMAREVGIEICSLATGVLWQFNLISEDREERETAKGHVRKGLELAGVLGVDTMLVVPGFTGPFQSGPAVIQDYEAAYNRALENFRELGPIAEQHEVYIGVENVWNKFLNSPLEMRDFIDRVGHPYVQCYFDVGNIMRTGYPEHWIRVLGSRIRKVHFKDFKTDVGTLEGFVELLSGDVNYPAVMEALRDVGYDGWCTAELSPRTHWPESILQATSQAMDLIFSGE
ncbi:MAG: sugar phosphate isomerase/epimerase family protein [Chloroflexota bacterium]|nr:sugar phosphate isomerase/epimerase family protein [Chloroflexota bacterium]